MRAGLPLDTTGDTSGLDLPLNGERWNVQLWYGARKSKQCLLRKTDVILRAIGEGGSEAKGFGGLNEGACPSYCTREGFIFPDRAQHGVEGPSIGVVWCPF